MKKMFLVVLLSMMLAGCGKDCSCDSCNEPDTATVATSVNFVRLITESSSATGSVSISKYVDLETGVVYIYTSDYASGYGNAMSMLVNPDGTPRIYDDLDKLRQKYGYSVE